MKLHSTSYSGSTQSPLPHNTACSSLSYLREGREGGRERERGGRVGHDKLNGGGETGKEGGRE